MDPGVSYTRHSKANRETEPVAIISVDTASLPPVAVGIMRTRQYVTIDISHYVGAVQVTPAVGEQWMIIRDRGIWKLDQQLPFNVPSTLETTVPGQVKVGGSGPLTLGGTEIQVNAPLRLNSTLYRDNEGSLESSQDNGNTWSGVAGATGPTGPPGTTDWTALTNKPAVIAAGASQAEARTAISAASLGSNGKVPVNQLPIYEINVKEYGAKGDGTTNDTAAINAAIAALSPGDILYFPRGRYTTNGGHVISTPAVTITGSSGRAQDYNSQAQIYLRSGSNSDMFIIAATSVTMKQLSLAGQWNQQTATSRGIVFQNGTAINYFLLDTVWVSSFRGDGMVIDGNGTSSGTIVNSESRDNKGYGLRLNGGGTDCLVSDCYFDQNSLSGILCEVGGDLSLSNCHIWGNGNNTGGFTSTGASYLDSSGEVIAPVTTSHTDGMTFRGSGGCRMINCNIESNKGAGIRFATGSNQLHIIDGCDIWQNSLQGIYAFGADHCVISNSMIRTNGFFGQAGSASAGIVLDSCIAMNITGNIFYSRTFLNGKSQTYGYYEVGTSNSDIYFRNNVCRASDHKTGAAVFGPGTITDSERYTTAARPSAASVGVGYQFFDTTLNKPVWSDGTNWRDAAGSVV